MFGNRSTPQVDRSDINPWLLDRSPTRGIAALSGNSADDVEPSPHRTGPTVPQHGRGAPSDPGAGLPIRTLARDPRAQLSVVGAHGGAGESVIAALDPSWRPTEHVFPDASSGTAAVVLTCRSHVPGLLAAQAAAVQWASGSVAWLRLLGLVIIADAPGRPPKPIRDLVRVVVGGVPRSWIMPWCEIWRLGESPPAARLPRPFRRLTTDISRLIDIDDDLPTPHRNSPVLEGILHAQP